MQAGPIDLSSDEDDIVFVPVYDISDQQSEGSGAEAADAAAGLAADQASRANTTAFQHRPLQQRARQVTPFQLRRSQNPVPPKRPRPPRPYIGLNNDTLQRHLRARFPDKDRSGQQGGARPVDPAPEPQQVQQQRQHARHVLDPSVGQPTSQWRRLYPDRAP